MAEIIVYNMGKVKDFMIDFLEDIGYEMGYDMENFHTVDKMTVTEYLQKAYTIKDKQKELELIKMAREDKIRQIVSQEMDNIHEEAYLDHLKNSHDQSDDLDLEGEGNNSHP